MTLQNPERFICSGEDTFMLKYVFGIVSASERQTQFEYLTRYGESTSAASAIIRGYANSELAPSPDGI